MAILKSVFKLYDGYSRTADVIEKKTQKATDKILQASGATDKFNTKLNATGVSAGRARNGLNSFIGKVITVAGLLKGASITDNFMNTSTRLDLINDGLQTQAELQDKIFASADRAKGSYKDMASSISKMGILAGEAFSSNNELITFTELIQKSFKIGGASQSEQLSALLQLTQAMAAGKLQGDEFRSIMENAPMVADAIARYMGKTKGELKEMSSQGLITADIIKNAMFMASDDINNKFSKMPKTFADVWNKIKNGAAKTFGPLMKRINDYINSEGFDKAINGIIRGFELMANAADKALDFISVGFDYIGRNWKTIETIIYSLVAAWGAYKVAVALATSIQWISNFSLMLNPIGLAIVLVAALAGAFVYLWETSEKFRSAWTSGWVASNKLMARFVNTFIDYKNWFIEAWDTVLFVIGKFSEVMKNAMVSSVIWVAKGVGTMVIMFGTLFDSIQNIVDAYNAFATVTGSKKIDLDFSTDNVLSNILGKAEEFVGTANLATDAYQSTLKFIQPEKKIDIDQYDKYMDGRGSKAENFTVSGWLKGLFSDSISGFNAGLGGFDSDGNILSVQGLGPNGAVVVNIADEDLQYLRDIAEREYVNRFSAATLAPNIQVTFGDVHETADADQVAGRIAKILQEEITTTAEGVYDV